MGLVNPGALIVEAVGVVQVVVMVEHLVLEVLE
jgi:hypothetical protein